MSEFPFDDTSGPIAGRVKTDYDPKHQNLPVTEKDVTQVSASNPHWMRCAIRRNPTREELADGHTEMIEVANWLVGPFPTRDAADSHAQEIRGTMKTLRGEPEQAWSEVAKMTRAPNASLFPKFRDLSMTLVPAQPVKSEPIPRDHPAYPNTFAAKRDIVTGRAHPEPGGTPSGSPGEERSGPDGRGPGRVRRSPAKRKAAVSGKRGGGKARKGKTK